ncbi:Protein archease-like [Caenorhabditis elegans]|uniref:Protein archease-like n=1 Tax=Caenorhabditis elegans TaxID=6239 RepID=ARCH_CAEEL|nr:Protein archease-like [Caenorhabditis elegans]Q9TZN1.1 RecName: Full=Protein archease-like [Caenorhabditis elegans]CCD62130.1 Protein archease-like [Caenorhabditis elegans]|eukprot:NP_492778.1 Protein archease-like [Caenorhabditis elegans]
MPSTSMIEDRSEIERRRFEYLDHPADIQLHSWGSTMEEAFEACLVSMFGYMTDLAKVDEMYEFYWKASGDSLDGLLFQFLDEALNSFHAEPCFVAKRVEILRFDKKKFEIEFRGWGESFDTSKHETEADIKSPTYSNMQINEKPERCDIYVIVDI